MPKKNYADRISRKLLEMRNDRRIQKDMEDPFFDMDTPPAISGEFFQMIADGATIDADDPKIEENIHPTARAFREANLDPQSPLHWDYLLTVLPKFTTPTIAAHRSDERKT